MLTSKQLYWSYVTVFQQTELLYWDPTRTLSPRTEARKQKTTVDDFKGTELLRLGYKREILPH